MFVNMITGYEIYNKYDNIQNDIFATSDRIFELTKIKKEDLYKAKCNGRPVCNLLTFEEWLVRNDNYDFYHTDTIYEMIKIILNKESLPPIIVDKDLGLYDGQHRLTAYSMVNSVEYILCYKEIEV